MILVYLNIVRMGEIPSGSPPNSIHAVRGGARGRVCPTQSRVLYLGGVDRSKEPSANVLNTMKSG